MKFEEAMKAYADKKRVGRNKKELMVTSGAIFLGGDLVGKDDVNATDWEIAEDKKTLDLSYKEVVGDLSGGIIGFRGFYRHDVKKAIKEFIDWWKDDNNYDVDEFVKKAKEIFGDKLI